MAKHIYFVRHGESESNVDHIHRRGETQLTDAGRAQAAIVAERIERIGVDALITSPYVRARDTAAAISARIGLPAEPNELLTEWELPTIINGRHRDDPVAEEVRQAISAAVDDPDYRYEDEETFTEFSARAAAAIRSLMEHPAERLCVVTHGGFLRALIGTMLYGGEFTKKDFYAMLRHFATTNTGITYVRLEDEAHGWQLVSWNDQSHFG